MTRIYQNRFYQNHQPIRFLNKSEEAIPSHGVVIVEKWRYDDEKRVFTADVRKCTEDDEKAQNHRMVLFNGYTPVAVGSVGKGFQTVPAIAILGRYGSDDDVPEPFSSVGPARDSWLLWKGGGTHTVQFILNEQDESEEDDGRISVALVTTHSSPGLWVKTQQVTGVATTDGYVTGTATLQNRDESAEQFIDAESGGDTKVPMEVEFIHGGGDIDADQIGQVKMVSGKWALDVQYCD